MNCDCNYSDKQWRVSIIEDKSIRYGLQMTVINKGKVWENGNLHRINEVRDMITRPSDFFFFSSENETENETL